MYLVSMWLYIPWDELLWVMIDLTDGYHHWVMWHTGRVLACDTVGPLVLFLAGPGDLVGSIPFYNMWHATPEPRQVGLVLKTLSFHNAASQWLYVSKASDRFQIHHFLPRYISGLRRRILLNFWKLKSNRRTKGLD